MEYIDLARAWKHNPRMLKVIILNAHGKRKALLGERAKVN